jgi:hypothetical protein
VSVRKSTIETCAKNALDSYSRIVTIARVVNTATNPAASNSASTMRSRTLR